MLSSVEIMNLNFTVNESFPEFLNFTLDSHVNLDNVNVSLEEESSPRGDDDVTRLARLICVGTLLVLIDVVAMLGNILVILAVFSTRRLKTVTNFFVVSLASADLMLSLSVMPLAILVELVGVWPLGAVVCDMWVSLDVLLCTASILNLCCISLDRYLAITRPLLYATKRSKRLALVMIFVVWCASIIVTCPPIFGWKELGRYEHSEECGLTQDPGYIIYSALGSFYIPMFVMVFVYARIYKIVFDREKRLLPYRRSLLHSRKKKTESSNSDENNVLLVMENLHCSPGQRRTLEVNSYKTKNGRTVTRSRSLENLPGYIIPNHAIPALDLDTHRQENENRNHRGNQQTRNYSGCASSFRRQAGSEKYRDIRKAEKALILKEGKTAKSLAIVVGGFVLCWLPFFVVYILRAFCQTCEISTMLFTILTWLGYFNSVINPFIYAFSNRDFRHAFWRLTCGACASPTVAL